MAMVLLSFAATVHEPVRLRPRRLSRCALSPAPRRDILLGKNLAVAPLALLAGLMGLTVFAAACPLKISHLLAAVPQFVSMLLIVGIVTNPVSIRRSHSDEARFVATGWVFRLWHCC